VLDGSCLARPDNPIHLVDSHDVLIEGITVRNGPGWTCKVTGGEHVTFRNVKVISFGRNGDGIDPVSCSDVTIEDCFFRCTDDCIAAKAMRRPDGKPTNLERLTVTGCVMGGWMYADGMTVGFEAAADYIRDVVVSNCDVLYARGGNAVGGHSAFSVICDGPAAVSNVRFEDIRVEADVLRNFELHVTDGQRYVKEPPGRITGVHLKNISWAAEQPIILHGHDADHAVEDVTFENCTIADQKLTATDAPPFEADDHVRQVRFL
jgi:polygalacturonase